MKQILFTIAFLVLILSFSNNSGFSQTNRALYFDGVDSYSQAPNSNSLNFNNQLTVMVWVKTLDNRTAKLVEKETWTSGWTMDQDKWNGWQAGFVDADGNGYSLQWGDGIPVFGKWYHIALTYDGAVLKLYVDGILKNSVSVATTIKLNSVPVSFGSDNGSQKFFKGAIDEVQIWNTALNEVEIDAIKDNYLTSTNLPSSLDWSDLKAYWSFDEATESYLIEDKSDYSNDGELYNMNPMVDRIESDIFDSENSTLPVSLNDFSGYAQGQSVVLSWTTLMELNNDKFILEYSINGFSFETVAEIAGAGYSNVPISYDFVDVLRGDLVYYRLKQMDFDGKTTISSTVTVSNSKMDFLALDRISVIENQINVIFNRPIESSYSLEIFDLSGRILMTTSNFSNDTQIQIPMSDFNHNAFVIVRITIKGEVYTKKLIVN
ncbi:MAG: T9SS type A sorting domain-containing protein [Bacteroidales bacterium]|nr:T9SS type A sorting domain-containing protein [Bacteroidales bacterium]